MDCNDIKRDQMESTITRYAGVSYYIIFFSGEYAREVQRRSAYIDKLDTVLNDACRTVTKQPENTTIEKVYLQQAEIIRQQND